MAGERILVVDDGQENRDFIVETILQPGGYQTLIAKDGVEGVDMALKYNPDLILLDLQMPRMNGLQVLKTLASRQVDIPIILMTFHGSEEIAIEVYRLGVRDYVKKPYTIEEMSEAIERSLTEVRLRREKEALTERVIQANRELQVRLQELNVMYSIGKSVASLLEMNQLMPRIVDAAVQIAGSEEGFLYLREDNKSLVCMAQKRQGAGRSEYMQEAVTDRIAEHICDTGQSMLLTPEQLNKPNSPISLAYVPLVIGKKVLGVLGVRNITPGTTVFTKHQVGLLSALTDYAAIAVENSRNYEALQVLIGPREET